MSQYSDLYPDVLAHIPTDPSTPLLDSMLRRVVDQFCTETEAWQFTSDGIDVTAGESEYEIEVEPGSRAIRLLSVTYDALPLPASTQPQLDVHLPGWREASGTPQYFTQGTAGTILLAPTPDANLAAGLRTVAVLTPLISSTRFPTWLANRWRHDIAAGAIGYLLRMTGKPWSDPGAAVGYLAQFNAALSAAKASSATVAHSAPIRTGTQH